MTRILLRAHKHPFQVADAETTLYRNLIGSNAGNLIFSQATVRLLSGPGQKVRVSPLDRRLRLAGRPLPGRPAAAAQARWLEARHDRIVMPLANAFRSSYVDRLEGLSELIERLRIPVTVLGVGAQARLDGRYGGAAKVAPAATRFVRAVLRRAPSVGVRGEFTHDYLRGLGFAADEVPVIGCPSMFMYGPDLPAGKPGRALTPASPVALNVSPYVQRMGPISLLSAERYPRLTYFAQNRETLQLLLTGHYPLRENEAEQPRTGVPITVDHPLIREGRTRFPLDPATWFTALAGYDFSFGSRIHGNIAALLAGTPAVVLAHDARTRELADYHQIPYRAIPADPEEADPARLLAEADFSGLHAGHAGRWALFADFLAEHGLRQAYLPGQDRGAAFDARLAGLDLPPLVRPLTALEPAELYAALDPAERHAVGTPETRAARAWDRIDRRIRRLLG